MKTTNTTAKKPRKTLERPCNRSEVSRRNRLNYLAKHPAAHVPFRTMKVQRPIVEEMLKLKMSDESWGAFFMRILRKAGFKIDVKI